MWLVAPMPELAMLNLPGLAFTIRDQLGHVLAGKSAFTCRMKGVKRHQRHELEALVRVVLDVALQGRIDDQRRAASIDRVAVGCGLGDEVGGHGRGRAGAVVDQHRLAELDVSLSAIDARDRVVHAARRIGHDHGDRLGAANRFARMRQTAAPARRAPAATNVERFIFLPPLRSSRDEERQRHLFVDRLEAEPDALADLEVGLVRRRAAVRSRARRHPCRPAPRCRAPRP